ncbi:MAG: hypothetical protein KA362_14525, partial [Chloroflexi bacterium]|nr:hypothetical protein [Chloroflexota bacterium]
MQHGLGEQLGVEAVGEVETVLAELTAVPFVVHFEQQVGKCGGVCGGEDKAVYMRLNLISGGAAGGGCNDGQPGASCLMNDHAP